MSQIRIRKMEPDDRAAVAELVCVSTNHWYQTHAWSAKFPSVEAADVFYEVYDELDPGQGLVAEDSRTRRLAGSCFVHPREGHVSLGILNVHPNHYGRGVGRALLTRIIDDAEARKLPVRLVSSAVNLDSYSLYTRAGFVPRRAYQDMLLSVPEEGLPARLSASEAIRAATADDVPAIVALEMELTGIRREQDYRYFLKNTTGYWHLSVHEGAGGKLEGFMASGRRAESSMIGPGLARSESAAEALLLAELDRHRGRAPLFLVPVDCPNLVAALYGHGARNCEIHFAQVRGAYQVGRGVEFPTFLPESA